MKLTLRGCRLCTSLVALAVNVLVMMLSHNGQRNTKSSTVSSFSRQYTHFLAVLSCCDEGVRSVVLALSFAYPFPDVAALTDLPYTSRSAAVRPTLQIPSSSNPPHPSPNIYLTFLCFVGLSLFLLVLNPEVFGVFLYVRNNLSLSFQ